jgi:predicted SnoaL-like aldol condensation-catalyzing enzyme
MNRRAVIGGLAGTLTMGAGTAFAQTPVSDDQEAANIETVRRLYAEVYNAQDPEAARGIMAPEYTTNNDTYAPGIDAFMARLEDYFREMNRKYTMYRFEIVDAIASGNVVVTRTQLTGVDKDGMQTVSKAIVWYELADGLIAVAY